MNSSQITGIIRIVGPAIIGVLAFTGVISDSVATNLTTFIATAAGAVVWSAVSNTTLNLSKAVAATPGLQVQVDHNAPPELQAAAADCSVRDIVPVVPSLNPYATQRKHES
jgi:hypothetical protein